MSKRALDPDTKASQAAKASEKVKLLHADPVWHAAWLEKTRAHHKRRKELVDRALEALKSQESPTS